MLIGARLTDQGTGLLSILAARAGAWHVYCCEMSEALCEVARECIRVNGCEEKVSVLNFHSSALRPSHLSRGPPQVLVTELVDSGLFGEHIVSVLSDARRLLSPDAIVIPHSASLWAQLIESEEIRYRKEHRNAEGELEAMAEEIYTCDNLSNLNFSALSAPFLVSNLSFSELEALQSSLSFSQSCRVLSSGIVDAVATWFELHLTDPAGDEPISVSTTPGRSNCGWDQAIHFVQGVQAKSGSDVLCRFQVLNEVMSVSVDGCSPATSPSRLGEMDIAALNDTIWWQEFGNAVKMAVSAFPESIVIESTSRQRSVLIHCDTQCEGVCLTSTKACSNYIGSSLASSHQHLVVSDATLFEHCSQRSDMDTGSFVLVCDLVEGSGLMRQRILQEIAYSLRCLRDVKRIIPYSSKVHVAIFESPETKSRYVVNSENTVGVDLDHINQYRSTRICELVFQSVAFRQLSDESTVDVDMSKIKNCDDIVVEDVVSVKIENPGTVHLVGFWFSFDLYNCHSLSLRANELSSSHCRQAGFMVDEFIVHNGDELEIVVTVSLSFGVHCRLKR